ncbi:MAG TPA: four helix bundle protein [Gemmatimonadaceae bacterium]|jgi:four helix bundle protein
MSDYRKLDIYHRARALSTRVHHLVKALPRAEQFRRGDQLIRSANSIRNNIVEGSTAGSPVHVAKYLRTSIGSADELQDQILALSDVELLPSEFRDLLSEPSEVAAMIVSYRKTVLSDGHK